MKRSGFTMIELIFVIVILGILASVAIPKLAATREDAKISKMSQNVATLVSDLGAYYTSQGNANWQDTSTTWGTVTNVDVFTANNNHTNGKDVVLAGSGTATVFMNADDSHNCLKFDNNVSGALTVALGGDTTGTVCKAVQENVSSLIKKHNFGGIGIVR